MGFSKEVKCVVWDLDNTVWEGTLLESDRVCLRSDIKNLLKELDARGILNSIASKNNHDDAIAKLKEFEIEHYFLYPEIHWNAKSESIKNIKKNLNIGFDTIMFIDDQLFELDEVASSIPEVECVNANRITELLATKRLNPKFITEDSKRRRLMYLEDITRNNIEQDYKGPQESFLKSLDLRFVISEAKEEDLKRAEELTVRTNQLNATGKTYDYDELDQFRKSEVHKLYVCELVDKYGSYGKIGLALVENADVYWNLKLLLMSCRVMSRGVGSVLLTYIMQQAKNDNKLLRADFRQTDRNRMMYVTYRFANFNEITNDGNGNIVFENNLSQIQLFPSYINVKVE